MRGLIAAVVGIAAGVLLAVLALRGCGGAEGDSAAEPPPPRPGHAPLRIASLSPALTRLVVDLGFEAEVVGRTTFCTAVPASVPVVGDLRQVDFERLLRLEPTHLLVQPPASGLDPALQRAAEEQGWRIVSYPSIDGIEEIRAVIRSVAVGLFAGRERDPAGTDPRLGAALQTAAAVIERLDRVLARRPSGAWTGEVLLVHDPDGVGVFGRGTWLSDAVIELGATNAVLLRGWPSLSLEDVARNDPPAIVLVTARIDDPRPVRERLGPLGDLDVEAVRTGRLAVVEDPEALLPSTSAIAVIERLGAVLDEFGRASAPLDPVGPGGIGGS